MNLRKITLRYMGWCPGVKSAARFIPDWDIPPSRIALLAVLAVFVYVPSFIAAQMALNAAGHPSDSLTRVYNNKPKLAVSDGRLYIAMDVTTSSMVDFQGPRYRRKRVYVAKLNLDGTLEDKVEVLDLGDVSLTFMDLLVTGDDRWLLSYKYDEYLGSQKTLTPSHIFVIESTDGRSWGEPIVVAECAGSFTEWMTEAEMQETTVPENPCLTEAENGEVFLSFNVNEELIYYTIKTPEGGWSPPVKIPMVAEDQSCFLDGEGRIAVIGVEAGDWRFGEPKVKGIPLTVMDDDGHWTEPRYLTYQQAIPIRGYHPRMLYSERHGSYFLLKMDPLYLTYTNRTLMISFTPDLEDWRGVSFERVWNPCLAELPDGTLVLVYASSTGEEFERMAIYISTSGDGVSWTNPRKIELIRDQEALAEASSIERGASAWGMTMASTVISLAVTAVVIIIAFKGLHLSPALQLISMSTEGSTP